MKTLALLGLQWGDEGKGKIIDHLSPRYDITVRFQGGGNAGHTVVVGDTKHILHHIPSGILHEGKIAYIGDGTVLDVETLFKEMAELEAAGIDIRGRLFVGLGTHLVMPYHKALDAASESGAGDDKIGTTKRGIGPCYADRRARLGLRFRDLFDMDTFRARLERSLSEKNTLLAKHYDQEVFDATALAERACEWAARLDGLGRNTPAFLEQAMEEGKTVLFEGAQGTLLDLDWGTYPFVTSSHTSISAVASGCGISPRRVGTVLGVVKAYTTRVGMGPFPTEDTGDLGQRLRDQGQEYGATTGRPRRCGWLDAVAGRYAVRLNGVDSLVVTKLDVLSGMPELKVCTSYGTDAPFDPDVSALAEAEPSYETFAGWQEDISGARSFADLPDPCHAYLAGMERLLGAPIKLVSVGPERSQVFERE